MCNNTDLQSLPFQVAQVDLTEVLPCEINRTHPVINKTVQIIQTAENHEIIVKACHIELFKVAQYCSWDEDASAIGKSIDIYVCGKIRGPEGS